MGDGTAWFHRSFLLWPISVARYSRVHISRHLSAIQWCNRLQERKGTVCMAKTFDGTVVFTESTLLARSLRSVSTLRLVLGLTALLGAIVFLEGTSWDIQWHTYIGRDRTLIPPHLMMLSG